jgi:hypothetical protein
LRIRSGCRRKPATSSAATKSASVSPYKPSPSQTPAANQKSPPSSGGWRGARCGVGARTVVQKAGVYGRREGAHGHPHPYKQRLGGKGVISCSI